MERNISNSPEYKFNPSTSASENASRSIPSTSNCNEAQEKPCRDHKYITKLKTPYQKEKTRERPVSSRVEIVEEEEEGKDRYTDDQFQTTSQQQGQVSQTVAATATYSNYYYTPDQYNAAPSQRPYSVVPQFGMFPVNQWVNPMEGMSSNHMTLPAAVNPVCSGIDMPSTSNNVMNHLPYSMSMPPDSSMYPMFGSNYCPYSYVTGHDNTRPSPRILKETITLTKCVLYAPSPDSNPPTLRKKPNGCKTVFVGGLPEKITEEIIREAFHQFGEIETVRMSLKNFCHIRFTREEYVEKALYLSGFRMKIENKDESPYSGKIHVDYAVARDDQHQYECARRAAQRLARHRALMELESREASLPAVPLFSEVELQNLMTKFKDGKFKGGVQVLVSWLRKGEVNKRNAGVFFTMIQGLNYHVRRLLTDKSKYEQDLNKAKSTLQNKMCTISFQFNEIEKLFEIAKYQKVWDHFTKAQRKNIDLWKKQTLEIKEANSNELIEGRVEDEMDLSDGEGEVNKDLPKNNEKAKALRDQIEELREQLASKLQLVTEVKKNKNELLDSMQKSYQMTSKKLLESQKEVDKYRALWAAKSGGSESQMPDAENNLDSCAQKNATPHAPYRAPNGAFRVSERHTRLIALISAFLNVHPFGAHIDYICSYLVKVDSTVVARDVENLMRLFPHVFEEKSVGIGATLEKIWTFIGFTSF